MDKNKIITPKRASIALIEMVRKERIFLGMTAKDIAHASDIPISTYRRFEQHGEIQSSKLLKVFHALGLLDSFAEFLTIEREAHTLDEFRFNENMSTRKRASSFRS